METISRDLLTFLINALWQIPIIAGVAFVTCRLMRNSPAAHRHIVWVAALFAALVLPLLSVRTSEPSDNLQLSPSFALPLPTAARATPTPAAMRPSAPSPSRTVPLGYTTAAIFAGAYLLVLLFRLVRLARAWKRTLQIRGHAYRTSLPPAFEAVWIACLDALHLRNIDLLWSATVASPVTVGAWRKVVILPESMLGETSPEVITTAIGHELAHIARHDFALNFLYELLSAPIVFHPALWLIRRGIETTREMACDEMVTQRLLAREVYARSIMSIAATMTAVAQPGLTLGVFDSDILEERIRRLLERPAASLKRARILLAASLSALAICVVVASTLALTARAQSGYRAEMKVAGDAYNRGDFNTAIEHFDNAVRLDPSNAAPKLFLANALMRAAFADNPSNSALLARAHQQYVDAVAYDPSNKRALEGLVMTSMGARQPREARDWAMKLIQADPKDKNGYYSVGVADWAMVFPEVQRARMQAAMKLTDYAIPDAALRQSLRDKFMPSIDEGLKMLQTALQLDPNHSDTMAYINLLDRLKSGLVDNPHESSALIAQADDWVGKALAARGATPKHEPSTSIDIDAPPPGPAGPNATMVAAPPPPPPPPPPPGVKRGEGHRP